MNGQKTGALVITHDGQTDLGRYQAGVLTWARVALTCLVQQ